MLIWNVGSISESPGYRTPVRGPCVRRSVFPLDDVIIHGISPIVH